MPRGKTTPVGGVLDAIIRRWERLAGGPIQRVIACWDEVVGDAIAQNARPVETEGDALVVEVRNAVWRDQLARFYARQIVHKLNRRLGGDIIRQIRFRVARHDTLWESC